MHTRREMNRKYCGDCRTFHGDASKGFVHGQKFHQKVGDTVIVGHNEDMTTKLRE